MVQLQLYPLGHVGRTGIDGAGGAGIVEHFKRDDLQFVFHAGMREGHIIRGLNVGVADIGVGHAERDEDALANVVIPRSAGHRWDDLPGGHVEKIVVGVMAAKTGRGFHEAQLVDNFVAIVGSVGPEEQIALAEPHAASMREQVADGHFVRDVGIVHDETGEALIDGIVPGKLAFVDQGGEGGGGEGFGVGADAEQGEFIDERAIPQFADSVAFGDQDLTVFYDGDGHAGNVKGLHGRGDVGVEIGGRGLCPHKRHRD